MAIQLPNPGLGDGQTGDNEFVMWTKVKNNFSDKDHAASRLVGTKTGNLVEITEGGIMGTGLGSMVAPAKTLNLDTLRIQPSGFFYITSASTTEYPQERHAFVINFVSSAGTDGFKILNTPGTEIFYVQGKSGGKFANPKILYHAGNTTKEKGTGYLVASSPVLKMQHDSFEKVHEAEKLDIEVNNIETGVYEITGTTGLRDGDGWNLKPPKDVNGNVLCICEATESNGVITLKTYKKKFDFETVSIVADYDQPTDIPEGAVIMLRFNDLPEVTDEPIE